MDLVEAGYGWRDLDALAAAAGATPPCTDTLSASNPVRSTRMTIKVAINGYGRIGRNILRAHYEDGKKHDLAIVAINDLGSPETNAHLTRYDTAHGTLPGQGRASTATRWSSDGDRIKVLRATRSRRSCRGASLGVDVVLESTGFFTTKEKASAHLKGGAKKVIISAPGGKDVDATIVYGVNHDVSRLAHGHLATRRARPTASRRWWQAAARRRSAS